MTELIPNCQKCQRKHGGQYKSNKIKIKLDSGKGIFALICKKCKKEEDKEADLNIISHEVAHSELNKKQ